MRVVLTLFWFGLGSALGHASPPLFLGGEADHFLDRDGELTIDELAGPAGEQKFVPAQGKAANYGPRPTPQAVLWLRFKLPAISGTAAGQWVLSFDELRVRKATLYQRKDNRWEPRVWNAENDHRKTDVHALRYPAFLVDLHRDAGTTVYLSIETASSMRAMLYAQSAPEFLYHYSDASLNYGIAAGLLGTLAIYLLAAGLAARDSNALLLSGLAGSYLTYMVSHMAFMETHLLPGALDLARTMSLTAVMLIFAFRMFYVDSFLGVRSHFPRLSLVLKASGWLFVGMALTVAIMISLHGQTSLRLYTSKFGVASFVLGQVAALLMLFHRPYRVAVFYLCWGPVTYFSLIRLLHDAAPSIGLRLATLNQAHFWMCIGFLIAGIVAGVEIYLNERRRRRNEEMISRRMQDIALSASNSFWETRPDGVVAYQAGGDARLLGFTDGQPVDLGTVAANSSMAAALSARQPFAFRFLAAGTDRTFEVRGRPYDDAQGTFAGYRGVVSDVSVELARIEREAHQQQLAAIGQLAGVVAHEINNLLHPIISLTRRAASTLPDDGQNRRWLETVTDAGQRAAEIVASLLKNMRPVNQRHDVVPLAEGIRRAAEALEPVVPDGMSLSLEISTSVAVNMATKDAFQMLTNLVSNAIYASQGRGMVAVALFDCHLEDGRAGNCLRVSDNGSGMDEATRSRVLEPFFSSKPAGQGTGLGMSIVALISREYQGSIAIQSRPCKGTIIEIRFPAQARTMISRQEAS